MASRKSRTQRDKRAEADALWRASLEPFDTARSTSGEVSRFSPCAGGFDSRTGYQQPDDAPLTTREGVLIDPRTPWPLP